MLHLGFGAKHMELLHMNNQWRVSGLCWFHFLDFIAKCSKAYLNIYIFFGDLFHFTYCTESNLL